MTSSTQQGTPAVILAAQQLSERIRRGMYSPGSRLPSERELAAQIGVSRTTLRSALIRLDADSLIQAGPGRGWSVRTNPLSEPPSVLQSFTTMARARGLTPETEVLEQRVRASTFDEAQDLSIAPSAPILLLRRLRRLNGVATCVDNTVLPHGVDELSQVDFVNRSLYDVLREVCDTRIARCSYTVQAVAASPEIAGLLEIDESAPVLAGREVAYDADGVPVSTGTTFYRGEAYQFQADLYAPAE